MTRTVPPTLSFWGGRPAKGFQAGQRPFQENGPKGGPQIKRVPQACDSLNDGDSLLHKHICSEFQPWQYSRGTDDTVSFGASLFLDVVSENWARSGLSPTRAKLTSQATEWRHFGDLLLNSDEDTSSIALRILPRTCGMRCTIRNYGIRKPQIGGM